MPDTKRYDEFVHLIGLHTSRILTYIDALLLNWNDAEDLFQDTCLMLWQRFDEFKPGTNFLAWALRIADHKVMKFRTKQSRQTAFAASLRDAFITELACRDAADGANPNLAVLSGCMDQLMENDRRIVMLCYAEALPVRHVAEAFGRSPQSVHNSLSRIRKQLLDCIRHKQKMADMPSASSSNAVGQKDLS